MYSRKQLVTELGAMASRGGLRVYANDDVAVGAWLVGHSVDRARLVAKSTLTCGIDHEPVLSLLHEPESAVQRALRVRALLCGDGIVLVATAERDTTSEWSERADEYVVLAASAACAAGWCCWRRQQQQRWRAISSTSSSLAQMVHAAAVARKRAGTSTRIRCFSLRSLVSIGIKVVTTLRNHLHFIRTRYISACPAFAFSSLTMSTLASAVGNGGGELFFIHDYNVTHIQTIPRSGLCRGHARLRGQRDKAFLLSLMMFSSPPQHVSSSYCNSSTALTSS